jgi:cell division control protein 7
MEYFRHGDFREYLPRLSLEQIQSYMFQLMTALAYLHNKGVIHRDVKPKVRSALVKPHFDHLITLMQNFLFNSETGDGRLIDFGLAEQAPEWQSKVHAEIRSRDAGVVAGEEKPAKRRRSSKTEPIVAQEIQPAVRPHMKPSRAGTFGFRAPEVLIQKLGQTPGKLKFT